MTDEILRETSHRPWPLPDGSWIMFQSWQNQLFAHWRIAPDVMRAHVPAELELDLFEGVAWLGITPFLLTGLRLRGLPTLPIASMFLELNLRTYVVVDNRPGVFFFSLDAASQLAVLGARATFGLPYHHANMALVNSDGWTTYHSNRLHDSAELEVRYRRTATAPRRAVPGTLDHFLVERYALYVLRAGNVMRGDIHHKPWSLYAAHAQFAANTIAAAAGLQLPDEEPLLHYSERQDALIWPLVSAART